jgi:hypothetical protein
MAGRLWAVKDLRALKRLYPAFHREEVTREQMVRVFNRSWKAITQKASELGLAGKAQSALDMEYFRELKRKYKIRRGGSN